VFFAEITFWEEFKTRFNFIAVDYLIYTHEVVANIQESYPLPVLVLGVILITAIVFFVFHKKNVFKKTFTQKVSLKQKTIILLLGLSVVTFYSIFITNNQAEWSKNRYNAEISKSGIYSFFAAFRNNQMEYTKFYTKISNEKAFGMIRNKLAQKNVEFKNNGLSIHRNITDTAASNVKQNVVFILVESLSASFMNEFDSNENSMPFLDSLAQKSIFFKNLYATGTRTVRGMEAVTLCIPPTPGQSIVKRPDNQNLFTVVNVFKSKQYNCNFFYGGDGYFVTFMGCATIDVHRAADYLGMVELSRHGV
jgi:phosphoglycerol transferase MdoB-like AlkP superfamily enzyme